MASFSVPCPKTTPSSSSSLLARFGSSNNTIKLSPFSGPVSKSSLSLAKLSSSPAFQPKGKQFGTWTLRAQGNEAAAKESSNSSANFDNKPGVASSDESDELDDQDTVPDASAISAFMSQVADLVKLVDSRDITELKMKQQGCELIIRKKEALQPAPSAAPPQMFSYATPPPPPVAAPAPPPPAPTPASPNPEPALALPAPSGSSSHPTFNCPMAGTFYRCPAPGQPPFVNVGDKVKKGQILCIVEAMKLMNEVECDRSGTITEILIEDGKPVNIGKPLFAIAPSE